MRASLHAVAVYRDQTDNAPKSGTVSWGELAEELTSHRRTSCTVATCVRGQCPHKFGSAWSPAEVSGTRANANVRLVSALVYDMDHVTDTHVWHERLKTERIAHVIHSTHSHREDDTCLRLVIQPSRNLRPDEYSAVWTAVIDRYGLPADRACKDLSRIYFVPSCPSDAEPLALEFDGSPLNVDDVLADTPQIAAPVSPADSTPDAAATPKKTIAEGGRNAALTAIAGRMRGDAMSVDAIAAALLIENQERCDPPLTDDEVRRIAQSIGRYDPTRDVARDAAFTTAWAKARSLVDLPAGALRIGDQKTLLDDYGADDSRLRNVWSVLIGRGRSPSELIAKSGDELLGLYNEATASATPPLAAEVLDTRRPPVVTYTTGFPALDVMIGGGIKTRSVTGIVARTGAGKTGLVIKIGHHIQRVHGVPFVYVSSELDSFEIAARAAAQELNVAHNAVLDGEESVRARAILRSIKTHVVGSETMDDAHGPRAIEAIERAVVATRDKYNGITPVVAIDFLQELAADDDDPSRVRMSVTKLARKMRALSRQLEVAIIAVSSTGRGFYRTPKDGADDPLTYLGAAKESGDVEFALANMLFLDVASDHVSGVYDARIVVAKARRGSTGFVGARFYGPSGRWEPSDNALDAMTGDARKNPRRDQLNAADDAKVLASVNHAASTGLYRTRRAWRELVKDVPERRVGESFKRLIPSRLTTCEYHPKEGNRAPGGSSGYVVPTNVDGMDGSASLTRDAFAVSQVKS